MASSLITLVVLAVGGYFLWTNKDQILGFFNDAVGSVSAPASSPVTTPTTTPAVSASVDTIPPAATKTTVNTGSATSGNLYTITAADQKLGPQNCASSAHEADLGFGFSKDGGPVDASGFTPDDGEPRVGDNRNNKSMTIAQLPGPCETKPYKGKVQYRYKDLSASCDTCVQAKRYFLYKYGVGGVNPIPGTGGEGVREGGKTTGKVVANKAVKGKAKAKYAHVSSAFFSYNRLSL